jgi:tight adherence protein C
MTVLFVIGLLLIAATVVLVVRALTLPRMRMSAHLRQIDSYGFSGTSVGDQPIGLRPPFGHTVNSFAEGVGRFAMATFGVLRPTPQNELVSAGLYHVSAVAFHGYRVLGTLILSSLLALEVISTGTSPSLAILVALLAAVTAWVAIGGYVRRRNEARLREIDRELPELIDVLIATVEAGMGFAGSLQVVAGRFEGGLGSELRLALQEQRMGLSTEDALSNILRRSDTPAMRSFIRAVVQGETLGVSIGTMMRNLATEMRTRRRQAAQERVQKAPLKMLFPLIFLIFPSLLIVLLYPAIHELAAGLAKI